MREKTGSVSMGLGQPGYAGDEVVVTGTPERSATCRAWHTGRFLKAHLRA
ncbi:MAG TPA: hypothetical protein VKE70_26035 [Candidatus Solibacter sp.]|nr:hypothetical protein [Candidatus Solibacter sp.]